MASGPISEEMATAGTIGEILERALEKAGIKDAGSDALSEDISTALDELNDMMLEWHDDGLWVDYSEGEASTDANTAWRSAHGAMKSHLAIRLCAEYQRPVPQGLALQAERQMDRMLRAAMPLPVYGNPGTFPIGQGNHSIHGESYSWDRYYSEDDDGIETGGYTLTDGGERPLQTEPDDIDGDIN